MNGTETRYTVDVSGQLPQVLQEQQSANVMRYLYSAGMMAVQHNGAWTYQHPDALGSVRQTNNILGVDYASISVPAARSI